MKIHLDQLLVTQNGIRNCKQVEKMIRFVKAGGRFTADARLAQSLLTESVRGTPPSVHIALMEDGQMVLHDGHHRAVACFLSGRFHFESSEYEIVKYTYADYAELHPEKGWFTPFDVLKEVRIPDFSLYKEVAREVYDSEGLEGLRRLVNEYKHYYLEPRRIFTVQELVHEYQEGCYCYGRFRRKSCV